MAIIDLSDKELRLALRGGAEHVHWSMNDLLREYDRRATQSNADTLRRLTAILVGATIVYTAATTALVIVTWLKP